MIVFNCNNSSFYLQGKILSNKVEQCYCHQLNVTSSGALANIRPRTLGIYNLTNILFENEKGIKTVYLNEHKKTMNGGPGFGWKVNYDYF